jgi:hypothetical protein
MKSPEWPLTGAARSVGGPSVPDDPGCLVALIAVCGIGVMLVVLFFVARVLLGWT